MGLLYSDASLSTINHSINEILDRGTVIPQDLCNSVMNINNDNSEQLIIHEREVLQRLLSDNTNLGIANHYL